MVESFYAIMCPSEESSCRLTAPTTASERGLSTCRCSRSQSGGAGLEYRTSSRERGERTYIETADVFAKSPREDRIMGEVRNIVCTIHGFAAEGIPAFFSRCRSCPKAFRYPVFALEDDGKIRRRNRTRIDKVTEMDGGVCVLVWYVL